MMATLPEPLTERIDPHYYPSLKNAMGMFDTLHLDPPLNCPVCAAAVAEVQTHEFGDVMAVYHIGSVMPMSPILTGIVKETFFCDACWKQDPKRERARESPTLYIGIWHSILVTVGFQLAEVEQRLAGVDRLDLIGWLDQAQRKAQDWERRFHHLRSDVERYRQHLQTPPEAAEPENPLIASLRRLWGLPDEVLNSPDPLGALLKRNDPKPSKEISKQEGINDPKPADDV